MNRAFTRWAYGIALLVAPESGVPDRFRAAIVAALRENSHGSGKAVHRSLLADLGALQAHRKRRMSDAIAYAPLKIRPSAAAIFKKLDTPLLTSDPWKQLLAWLASLNTPPTP